MLALLGNIHQIVWRKSKEQFVADFVFCRSHGKIVFHSLYCLVERYALEDPVPVGIYIDDCPLFNENFACADDNSSRVVIGIVRNSPAVEITTDLIIYITGKAY